MKLDIQYGTYIIVICEEYYEILVQACQTFKRTFSISMWTEVTEILEIFLTAIFDFQMKTYKSLYCKYD